MTYDYIDLIGFCISENYKGIYQCIKYIYINGDINLIIDQLDKRSLRTFNYVHEHYIFRKMIENNELDNIRNFLKKNKYFDINMMLDDKVWFNYTKCIILTLNIITLSNGININLKDKDGKTLLMYYSNKEDYQFIIYLKENFVLDFFVTDKLGNDAYNYATINKAENLISFYGDIKFFRGNRLTLILQSIVKGNYYKINEYVKIGIKSLGKIPELNELTKIEKKNLLYFLSFESDILYNRLTDLDDLLDKTLKYNIKLNRSFTLLRNAYIFKTYKSIINNMTCSNLIKIFPSTKVNYFDENLLKCDDGNYLIHNIVNNGDEEMLQLAIDNGIELNKQNVNGLTPLHFCCKNNNFMFKLLMKHINNIEIEDKNGKTPIYYLSEKQNTTFLLIFIKRGVNFHHKDNDGNSPIDIFNQNNCIKLNDIIKSKYNILNKKTKC